MTQPEQPLALDPAASARTGVRLLVGEMARLNAGAVLQATLVAAADVAVVRVPVDAPGTAQALQRVGWEHHVAQTELVWQLPLGKVTAPHDLACTPATAADLSMLAVLLRDDPAAEHAHVTAHPQLATLLVPVLDAAMLARTAVVRRDGHVLGVFTRTVAATTGAEVFTLHATLGAHAAVLACALAQVADGGVRHIEMRVAVQDVARQGALVAVGARPVAAWSVLHLWPWLSASAAPEATFDLTITAEEVQRYGDVTGDHNPIHFDPAFAQAAGLKGPIAHGIIANAVASNFYGTQVPGAGTLFVGYRYKFLAPLFIGDTYRIRVSFPLADHASGRFLGVFVVRDGAGTICLVSHSDLLRR